jgi:hypothetical protein
MQDIDPSQAPGTTAAAPPISAFAAPTRQKPFIYADFQQPADKRYF